MLYDITLKGSEADTHVQMDLSDEQAHAMNMLAALAEEGRLPFGPAMEVELAKPVRRAIVQRSNGRPQPSEVDAYMPANYAVKKWDHDRIVIEGQDNAGWTLDDYVIPRLASGLIYAKEAGR